MFEKKKEKKKAEQTKNRREFPQPDKGHLLTAYLMVKGWLLSAYEQKLDKAVHSCPFTWRGTGGSTAVRQGNERRGPQTGKEVVKLSLGGFPGGAVVENLPANAGDMGSSPGLGRSHMPRSN